MARLKLSPPWDIYATEIAELFKYDAGVHVIYDHELYTVKLYVDDGAKAEALSQLLPGEKLFGGVTLYVEVIPANGFTTLTGATKETLYNLAFKGNEAFSRVKAINAPYLTNDITYVVFVKKVVQFYTDNLGDLYGFRSTLYQEIAKDVIDDKEGVFFCTEAIEPALNGSLGSPLGEWP